MLVPLTTDDFLTRGAAVYPDRVAVIDEPDQPGGSLGALTFAELQRRVRAIGAGLDEMGIAAGERIAVASLNAARMLELFYAATATGRIVVPINFRLKRDEVAYIVQHSGASLLLVDAELDEPLAGVPAPRRLVLGPESDDALLRFRHRAGALGRDPRERHRDDQLYERHDCAPEGRRADAPQHLAQRHRAGAAPGRHGPRRLPAHRADVPRQRLEPALRPGRLGRDAGDAAQRRRGGGTAAGRAPRRDLDGRRPRRA